MKGSKLKKEHSAQKRICKSCKVEKDWIFKKFSGMQRLYVDETGKMWLSALCYECGKMKYDWNYNKKRIKRKKLRLTLENNSDFGLLPDDI